MRRPDAASLRGAWWAQRAAWRVRRELRARMPEDVRLPAPPDLPPQATRGVRALLRRRQLSCLEQALVLQRWLAAQGDPRDVVIGVRGAAEFGAHAWVDGEPPANEQGFHELVRVRP